MRHTKLIETHKTPEYERGATLMERYNRSAEIHHKSSRVHRPGQSPETSFDGSECLMAESSELGSFSGGSLQWASSAHAPKSLASARQLTNPVPKLLFEETWSNQLFQVTLMAWRLVPSASQAPA